jgi:hypothetical protein
MSVPIKSQRIQARIKAIREQQVEMPTQVFNKMCFGFVQNDYIAVISSVLKLTTFALVMCFSRSV